MSIQSSNVQWPSEHDYLVGDRGTEALGVKDIQTEIPDQIVATEDFETDPISGSGTWTITLSNPHTGLRCLRSAVIGNNQDTQYTFNVPLGATTVRFWHRVSSESGFDFFEVYKDSVFPGNLLFSLSGTANVWAQQTEDITGASTIIFRYVKDASVSAGLDAAFVDDIEWIIPGIPGIQKYEPFHLTLDNCVKVSVCEGSIAVSGTVDTRQLDCETDSITVCPPVSGFDVSVINDVDIRPLDCEIDSLTVCPPVSGFEVTINPGDCPIPIVGCVNANVRLTCEDDSITVCPPEEGFEVTLPPPSVLTDFGSPFSITGPTTLLDGLYRAFSLTVIQGPVTINGITVPTGYSLSRSADPGQTVPGFSLDGTGGQIIVDVIAEL